MSQAKAIGFSEVLYGHEVTYQRFVKAYRAGRLHHAWLLYGVHGIGKRMLAERLAASYLCESEMSDSLPCGDCHACRMLASGAHPDYIYVGKEEKKRDISIAQIRGLQSFLSLSGRQSSKKVALLDEADRMNMQAANALLKGLEEPPEGSLLLIVCQDLPRIPATVRSRCMLEHCAPLNQQQMTGIASQLPLPDQALSMLLEVSQGCPGRIMALRDPAVAEACLQWNELIRDITTVDIAQVQDWMQKQVNLVPHDLIAGMLFTTLSTDMLMREHELSYADGKQLFDVLHNWQSWPQEVQKHSLRAAPTLFSRFMDVRLAVKACG